LKLGKKYETTVYRDADHASWEKAPEAYTIEKRTVTNKTRLSVRLASGGGCAISLIEK
jgi:alpha-glucosidase